MEWDRYFIEMATLVSKKSKDRSTKVGCVIVGPNHEVRTTGYNGFCRGINDDADDRHDRPEKYFWVEHAERNAIYNAARNGIPLEGCTAYVSNLLPCADCTRGMIQSGIKRIIIKIKVIMKFLFNIELQLCNENIHKLKFTRLIL